MKHFAGPITTHFIIGLALTLVMPALGARITLRNGAVVDAEIIKETPEAVFTDLGSEVVTLARDEIVTMETAPVETGDATPGVEEADATALEGDDWRAISANAYKHRRTQTSTQVLDNVKRGVVLVSTPGGWGSGFVIDRQGHILTNQHVVLDEKYVDVTIAQEHNGQPQRKKIKSVEIVALSPLLDVALLKIPDEELEGLDIEPLPLAPERSLTDGARVFAIGNPGMGRKVLDMTLSQGIVSSAARNFNDVLYIQTTAAVNPGNSGGPLVNAYGEVIGIVSLRAVFQEGIAFALPVEYIRHFLFNQKAYAYGKANPNTGYHYLSPE